MEAKWGDPKTSVTDQDLGWLWFREMEGGRNAHIYLDREPEPKNTLGWRLKRGGGEEGAGRKQHRYSVEGGGWLSSSASRRLTVRECIWVTDS